MSTWGRSALALTTLIVAISACSGENEPSNDVADKQDEKEKEKDESQASTSRDAGKKDAGAKDAGKDAKAGGEPDDQKLDQRMLDAGTMGRGLDGGAAELSSDSGAVMADAGMVDTFPPEPPVEPLPLEVALPIVFIHGFAGSAQQYESQAMRFVANGYDPKRIYALDHDGEGFDTTAFVSQAEALIDEALAAHDVDKVYLVGHSRGTFVSSSYLGNRQRAAKVAKYISLDGSGCSAAMSADVPCIAPSQSNLAGHKHVEVATSAQSFVKQYEFLIGKAPKVVDIVRQSAPVEISGRAVNFPANTGRAGTTLEIWELDSATGHRAGPEPLKSFSIDASGDFGPLVVSPDKHYELVLVSGQASHHFYPQRFLRSNQLVRLLSGPPDSPSRMNTNTGEGHAAAVAMRMREWTPEDILEISSTSKSGGDQPVVNAIVSAVGAANIAIFLHDDTSTPKRSSLASLPAVSGAFQAGVDVYLPAANPPDGTLTFTSMPRGDKTKPQVIKTANWASTNHTITLMFSDFPQN